MRRAPSRFGALSAGGGHPPRAGGAAIRWTARSRLSTAVARSGTPFRPEGAVRGAAINGNGRPACGVTSGRRTTTGMKKPTDIRDG